MDEPLYLWGNDEYGTLGDGENINKNYAVSPGDFTSYAPGSIFVLALKDNGDLYAWGYNYNGQLGTGDTVDTNTPVFISGGWDSIIAGGEHSFGIKNGDLYAWGGNYFGQLGDGTLVDKYVPTYLGVNDWAFLSAGYSNNLGLKANGDLYAWGGNYDGQLGDGTNTDSPTPIFISGGWAAISAATDGAHCAALKPNGDLYTWGNNGNGQLGDGTFTPSNVPVFISGGWAKVFAGGTFTLAITTSGDLYAWGRNVEGQLGTGDNTDYNTPTFISGGWESIGGGTQHSFAIKPNGDVYVWGDNTYGQLGLGDNVSRNTPTLHGGDWSVIKGSHLGCSAMGTPPSSSSSSFSSSSSDSSSSSSNAPYIQIDWIDEFGSHTTFFYSAPGSFYLPNTQNTEWSFTHLLGPVNLRLCGPQPDISVCQDDISHGMSIIYTDYSPFGNSIPITWDVLSSSSSSASSSSSSSSAPLQCDFCSTFLLTCGVYNVPPEYVQTVLDPSPVTARSLSAFGNITGVCGNDPQNETSVVELTSLNASVDIANGIEIIELCGFRPYNCCSELNICNQPECSYLFDFSQINTVINGQNITMTAPSITLVPFSNLGNPPLFTSSFIAIFRCVYQGNPAYLHLNIDTVSDGSVDTNPSGGTIYGDCTPNPSCDCPTTIANDHQSWNVLSSATQYSVGSWSGNVFTCDESPEPDSLIAGSATWTPTPGLAEQMIPAIGYQKSNWCYEETGDNYSGAPDQEYGATSYTLTINALYIAATNGGDPTPMGPLVELWCMPNGTAHRVTYTFQSGGSIDVTIEELQPPCVP